MIRIKAVDAQNLLDVCRLATAQDCICAAAEGHFRCNAVSIAETKYNSEMHPNAIYNNNTLIGFFMYERAEDQAETATIRRFMVDDRFQRKGLEKKALEHILRGLKIQGVKKVILITAGTNEKEKHLYCSSGFHFSGKINHMESCFSLDL